MGNNFFRGRRLRRTPALRELVRETWLRPQDLIQPYFVVEGDHDFEQSISTMPGQSRLGLDKLEERIIQAVDQGLKACLLFGLPETKDLQGTSAYAPKGIVQKAVARIKKRFPQLVVITDVCLCEYTSHGHCGLIEHGEIQNDSTLELLVAIALSHAQAGADIVAPSDMMDGRVTAIRTALDANGLTQMPIMSYAVKYASAYYSPFREAAQSMPQFGDRKSYQMDPANRREALAEARADDLEGADILMVKPGLPYLDILRDLRENFEQPLAIYQVSGEYAMIKAAAINGWIDERNVILESLTSLKRAGANLILSYFTEDVLKLLI
ncbi:porphobilinogen synthase [Desulfovibrionales bacterium]